MEGVGGAAGVADVGSELGCPLLLLLGVRTPDIAEGSDGSLDETRAVT